MAQIKFFQADHTKSQKLSRRIIGVSEEAGDSLLERAEDIRQQHGLKKYSIGNLVLSYAMRDPEFRKILKRKRKEAKRHGRSYIGEREV